MSRRPEQDLLAAGPPGGAGADPADGWGRAGGRQPDKSGSDRRRGGGGGGAAPPGSPVAVLDGLTRE